MYVIIEVEVYDPEVGDWVDYQRDQMTDYSLFEWQSRWRMDRWLCKFIDDHLCDFHSFRFTFFLKTEHGDYYDSYFIDLPLKILELFDVFKSEICASSRDE